MSKFTKTKQDKYMLEKEHKNIKDVANPERMKIIFGDNIPNWEDSLGGTLHFAQGDMFPGEPISIDTVKELRNKGYLSFKQHFNSSPTIGKLVENAEIVNDIAPENGECRLIGYAVNPKRIDCRITIEGARYDGPVTKQVRKVFKREFGTGYEFSESENHLRRWHD